MFALATPLLVGVGGLGVETSFDYFQKTHLQAAADAAAYAAALENRAASPPGKMEAAAVAVATSNGWSSNSGALTLNYPPTSGPNQTPTAVEVILTQNEPRFFSAYFVSTPLVARARAVAIYTTAADARILALDKTAPAAVQVQGNSSLTLTACDIMSNSVASDAVNVWGSATLSTDCVVSAGGVTNHGGLTINGCPSVVTQAPRARDPFAGLPVPPQGVNRNIPNGHGTISLSPGYYNGGMSLSGTVVLAPGVYYVSGGNFLVNANANVSGSGVTIYLAAGSQVDMRGTASITLSAPTTGTYAGILFFGDPSATSGSNVFNGDAASLLTGDLYFPTQQVSYQGNFSGQDGCMQIVADTVQWTGNATVGVDCTSHGMSGIPARQAVKLVE